MVRRKVIIDTDCGGDDAIGIMSAMTHPEVEILAILAVWGNVDVEQGMENLGKLLDLYGRDIPFYRGAAGPLVVNRETVQWGGFGRDGFGDAGFPPSPRVAAQSKKHASLALVEILRDAKPDEDVVYQLVCLGPLTNIALAIRLDPSVFEVLGSETEPAVTVMGGTSEGKGNSNLMGEFNFHCDPEAAFVVFHSTGIKHPIQMVNWEVTVNCAMPWRFYDEWVGRRETSEGLRPVNQNKTQWFIEKMFQRLETFTRPEEDGTRADTGDAEATQDVTCVIPDAVAMLVALDPTSLEDSFFTYVTVELQGRETRGATCIDWYGTEQSMAKKGRWRNCNIITKVNCDKFLEVMRRIVDFPL
ncbi:putative inosine-guanine nucleoside hydrolase [Trypanosoma cruzi]|uniref:Inosine-guanine nucleoside hydrolase n=2 Tax=Trypanosoma cruzi TaxID=5693 RepID=V5DDY4_TRYCR|nr:inosine-guanine nucleoside hydrolase [Trypanosoma cruzi Dm28c]KAF8289951.1 putative nucleoside hydrolase [Trypanosoma cruzi]PBJ69166.1 inosine-guanine nucleoside hydrolase (IG-NH) [Trypanosoma cruzi cruzi]PWU94632.1 putative inosine-guanine nucleoside hydrolase [Trypanosoma cruzi]RNF19996.1 putative inosine-guanine nucleoside hydrolase [Trypanosoma cruzi]